MSHVVRRGHRYIIVLNVQAPTEDRIYDILDSFDEELECTGILDKFFKYHMKMLLTNLNAKLGEKIFSNQRLETKVSTSLP
jgi:hypothetical protein